MLGVTRLSLRSMLVVALGAFLIAPQSARSEQSHLDDEARALFALVSSEEKQPERCQYDLEWDSHPIPDYLAREVFGIQVHGGLVAPAAVGEFPRIVDPDGRQAAAFCSPSQIEAYSTEKLKAFEASADNSMQINRTLFAYPVFDEHLRTAIVVVSHLALDGRFRWNGRVARHPTGSAVVAKIYRKVKGKWRLSGSRQLEIS